MLAAGGAVGVDGPVFEQRVHGLDGRPGVEGGGVVHVGEQRVVRSAQAVDASGRLGLLAAGDGLALLHRLDVGVGVDGEQLGESGGPGRLDA